MQSEFERAIDILRRHADPPTFAIQELLRLAKRVPIPKTCKHCGSTNVPFRKQMCDVCAKERKIEPHPRNPSCLCVDCDGTSRSSQHLRCTDCAQAIQRQREAASHRSSREARRKAGRCVACGANELATLRTCESCRQRTNARYRKGTHKCEQCSTTIPAMRHLCDPCREEWTKLWYTRRYRRRKDAGLCPHCGGARDLDGLLWCSACRKRQSESQIRWRQKRMVS